jgi:uncharacterized protein related to proFAR isomerase
VRGFVCPSCSEVACLANETATCDVCGDEMIPMEGCLHVSVPDRPGELAKFLKALAEREINVTALRVISRRADEAQVLFSVDKSDVALGIPGVRHAEDVAFRPGTASVG